MEFKNNSAFKNLDYCVNTVLSELNDYSTTNYQKYLQLAIRGFRQLNLMTLPNIKVEYLTVNTDNNTVDLPYDFVDYTKVGVCRGGQIVTLSLNESMCMPRKNCKCGGTLSSILNSVDSVTDTSLQGFYSVYGNSGYFFASHFRNGQYVGEMYGMGGGFNESYFRIDKQRHQIAFSDVLNGAEIVLEYISSGIERDGSAIIPVQAVEVIIAYIHWQRIYHNPLVPMNEKQEKKQNYIEEETMLRHFEFAPTVTEIMDTFYQSYKSSPKR